MSKTAMIGFILVSFAALAMVIAALLLKYNQSNEEVSGHTSRVFVAIEAGLSQRVTSFSKRISAAAAEFSRYPDIDTFSARLDQHFPRHQGAEFFPLDYKAMQSPSGKALSYASLVMLREAETRAEATDIWVQGSDANSRHIAFGHRVSDVDGNVLGVIAVNMSTGLINLTLQQLSAEAGRFELHQVSDGSKSLVIASVGDAGVASGVPDQVGSIRNTQWELRFWRAPTPLFVLDAGTVMLLSVAALALLGVGFGFVVLFRNLKEKLRQDQIELITAYEGRIRGIAPERMVAHLADNAGLVAHINRLNEEQIANVEQVVDSAERPSEQPEELLQALYAKELDIDLSGGAPPDLMNQLDAEGSELPEAELDSPSTDEASLDDADSLPDPFKNISNDALEFAFELEPKPESAAEAEPDFAVERKDSR